MLLWSELRMLEEAEFELPFDFQGDPVMQARVNGLDCKRCVLDTGAAQTVLVVPPELDLPHRVLNATEVEIDSLQICGIEFGPLKVRLKRHKHDRPGEFAVYLGLPQICDFCLTLDYERSVARFSRSSPNFQGQSIHFSRGRPIITLKAGDQSLNCILDTGSNGHWLFHHAQQALLPLYPTQQDQREIGTGFGTVQLKQYMTLPAVQLGGQSHDMKFLLANAGDFGGDMSEDGIVGTGGLVGVAPVQVLDFLTLTYSLR